MKRGIVSPVFTYIFVIIAGSVILLFFTYFSYNQLYVGNRLNAIDVAKTLDDNLNSFIISKNSDKDINFGFDVRLLFNNIVCGTLSLDEGNNIRTNKVIFSPKVLDGDNLKTWTLSWKYPFHITNFYYLSNEDSIYYLVYDSNSKKFVEDTFFDQNSQYKIPSRFGIRKISKSDLNNNLVTNLLGKYDFVKLVYFTQPNLSPNDRLRIVEIDNNIARFYNEDREDIILSEEFMIGAIFSEDYNNFRCGFDQSISNLKSLSKLYLSKQEKLSIPAKGLTCNYAAINSNLNYFITTDPTIANLQTYNNNVANLQTNNNDLEGDENCESLF
ncbi:hypothetical protein HYX15_01865 [Candidatus Woesearchaeota archaeon]|nr:hypothetical protein [Candidatus Woesearchaeota archaeon]